jgi:microcystin synthetase protein McyG
VSRAAERFQELSPVKQALLTIEQLQAKLDRLEREQTEPIAIIGMGCRFPGGSDTPETFWQQLRDGVDAITAVPEDRWDLAAYYDPHPDTPGKMYTRYGGFLEQIDGFDPQFFGIAPREARSMSPQQRLLLEVTWETLEHANQAPDRLFGSSTGVFVGMSSFDYTTLPARVPDTQSHIDAYMITGNALSVAAGRLSYTLGLTGPSMVIDTACASSLVAVHQACQSLRQRVCDLALAGGVHLMLTPEITIALCRLKALAPDGRCKTFDARADGFARAEGCGMIALKRLSDAVADEDRILALIRGSAVNQDGASGGLTVPSGAAQQAVIQQALEHARVEPSQISYIETHGTGTPLGDPIEVAALECMARGRPRHDPLLIGSLKTNIGHLEGAAGIAGLIKVVLSLQHEEIPPHLHFERPNPHIPWDELPVVVPTERRPWPRGEQPRRAGVSAFGFSGTNVHVVLEEAPAIVSPPAQDKRPVHLLALSAKTPEALRQLARRYEQHLVAKPGLDVGDMCFSANTGRSHFTRRLSVVAAASDTLREKLAAWLNGKAFVGVCEDQVHGIEEPRVAFLFTGQGSQYTGMGRQLYQAHPAFRQTLDHCDDILRPYLRQPLLSVLYPEAREGSPLDETAYTQPALFALEYALAELWKSWGIEPAVVMGHSVGEYVAACVAGVFSLEDALKLTVERGRLMQSLPEDGGMAAVFADEKQVTAACQPYAKEIAIAAMNGPQHMVISGTRQAVRAVCAALRTAGIESADLQVTRAFHSPLMEPIVGLYEPIASQVTYCRPHLDIISNVTGQLITDAIATPAYWVRHVREPVQFATGMATLYQLLGAYSREPGPVALVEVGPKPTLLGMARNCLPDSLEAYRRASLLWLPSLRQGQSDWQQLLQSLGALYVSGVQVDWHSVDRHYPRQRLALPTYPFQRQTYRMATSRSAQAETAADSQNRPRTPLINLLDQGEIQPLIEQLERAHAFSEAEKQLLPKLLDALVHQHQKQVTEASVPHGSYEVKRRPNHLCTPGEIRQRLVPQLTAGLAEPGIQLHGELLPRLEALSVTYVLSALQQMGWEFQLFQRFTTASMAELLGVQSQHQRLLGRLLEMLAEEGILRRRDETWEVAVVPGRQDPLKQMQSLCAQYPAVPVELTLLERAGSSLTQVLRGECHALQVLFPEEDLATATHLYQDSLAAKLMNPLVQSAVVAALERWPQERSVHMLEIGAGTGGTTSFILPYLPAQQTDYLFTDVSPLFLQHAQEKFRDYHFVRYQLLDIDQAPGKQGFASHQYDLIVAANVLHATEDLSRTLWHVQRLLASGGILVLLEATASRRWIDLFAGGLEGWWKFTDVDVRPSHPLLSAQGWQQLLEANGFQEVVSLDPAEFGYDACAQAVMVAQAVETREDEALPEPQNGRILVDTQHAPMTAPFDLLHQGDATSLDDQHAVLIAYLREQVAMALGMPASQLDVHLPLNITGLDSLMATGMCNRLKAKLGVDIPVATCLEGLNVIELAAEVSARLAATQSTLPADVEPGFSNLKHLSDAEVETRLLSLLSEEEGREL